MASQNSRRRTRRNRSEQEATLLRCAPVQVTMTQENLVEEVSVPGCSLAHLASKQSRRQRKLRHSEDKRLLAFQCPVQANSTALASGSRASSGIALVVGLGPQHSIYGRDAKEIAGALECKGYDVILHMDGLARKHLIKLAFEDLRSKAWPGCTCVVYFGSHADDDSDGQMRLLPVEGYHGHQAGGIAFDWLRGQVTDLPVHRVMLLMDCCYSGLLLKDPDKCSKRLWKERSFALVTSCDTNEESCCYAYADRSPFARLVVDALIGAARISAMQLAVHVQTHMPRYEKQHPQIESRGQDFLL